MEELSVLLFTVIIILQFSLRSNIKKQLHSLELEMQRLRVILSSFHSEKPASPVVEEIVQAPVKESPPETEPVAWQSNFRVVEEASLSQQLESLLQESKPVEEPAAVLPLPPPPPPPPRKPSFLERNPDMEKFIGENLISKVGIAILVLAIGYFVKFAIDNDWIGPVGRVGVGILCGGILVALAHRMRSSYKAFSSVLAGGGLAIFYFTIALAYHQFHLFSQTVSFVIMLVITGFAVVLSQLYNRQELAIIALIGGFATPFMVSNGSGNYKALFWYLTILNGGLLAIAYNKAWRLLNALAFIFTTVLFASWLFTLKPGTPPSTYGNGLMFATVFYLLFFLINIAHNIRENKKFLASDFSILLANTALYFTAGLYLISAMHAGEYKGLFTASISVFNLVATYFLFRNRKLDTNILYLLIGITLSFISLTAPIQLNGHNITLFWASEAVLLYWLFQKSKIPIIRFASYIVWVAMLVSLTMDWFNVYVSSVQPVNIILNRAFITGVFAAIASYILSVLKTKDTPANTIKTIFLLTDIFRVTGIMLLFMAGLLEINYQFNRYYPGLPLYILYLLLYLFAFVLAFLAINQLKKTGQVNWYIKSALMTLCIATYLFNIPAIFAIQKDLLEQNHFSSHFIAHWIAALLLIVIFYRLINLLRRQSITFHRNTALLTWALCIACIIFLSAEVHLVVNNIFFNSRNSLQEIQRVYIKSGLPIVWGLSSFGFMWLGMKHSYRTLRIISLTLFLLTLLKLFIFDIRNIPAAGKIAAFFCLGILLLVVSFMYQRLKKIIIEDEKLPSV